MFSKAMVQGFGPCWSTAVAAACADCNRVQQLNRSTDRSRKVPGRLEIISCRLTDESLINFFYDLFMLFCVFLCFACTLYLRSAFSVALHLCVSFFKRVALMVLFALVIDIF